MKLYEMATRVIEDKGEIEVKVTMFVPMGEKYNFESLARFFNNLSFSKQPKGISEAVSTVASEAWIYNVTKAEVDKAIAKAFDEAATARAEVNAQAETEVRDKVEVTEAEAKLNVGATEAELKAFEEADAMANAAMTQLVEDEAIEVISDTQLLNAISRVAEKIGADRAKEIIKTFAVGRGRPTVKNIPDDRREEFIQELKAVMEEEVTEVEVAGVVVETSTTELHHTPDLSTHRRKRRS